MAESDPSVTISVDRETGRRVSLLARRLHVPEADILRRAVERLEQSAVETSRQDVAKEWLASFDRRFPVPAPNGERADKAFFDDLSGGL